GMCKARIEKAAAGPGLKNANWDPATKILELQFVSGKFNIERAKQRILDVGHDVDDQRADETAYKNLPACCQYHDEKNVHVAGQATDEHVVRGVIMQENNRGELSPIAWANVYWLENGDIHTQSDSSGVFRIPHQNDLKRLVVSYAGLRPDTLAITNPNQVVMVTAKGQVLAEVAVSARRNSNYIAALTPTRLEVLTGQELF